VTGALLGLAYGFISGFIGGWSFAFLRNAGVFLYMAIAHRSAERELMQRFLQYL
jgi:hypothetical protein